jgi:uncharacterized protein
LIEATSQPIRQQHEFIENGRILAQMAVMSSARAKTIKFSVITAGLACVVTAGLLWWSSSELICPARRQLEEYHQVILKNPRDHGMRIEAFTAGVHPCLMCEPVSNPGSAIKGNTLRQQLKERGVEVGPWGEVRGTLVLLHGHSGCKEDFLPVAERFCAAGLRCLLVDLPGHGLNPYPFTSFGIKERTLPLDVLQAGRQKFSFKESTAGLFGISQGGAMALFAADASPSEWTCIAELSGFAALDRVVKEQASSRFGPLAGIFQRGMELLVEHRAGYSPNEVRPVEAASRIRMPTLIGHGVEDSFVTPDHATELFAAIPATDKRLLFVDAAGHRTVLTTSAPVYAELSEFFLRTMRASSSQLSN